MLGPQHRVHKSIYLSLKLFVSLGYFIRRLFIKAGMRRDIKMKPAVTSKTLPLAKHMLRVSKNHNNSMAKFDEHFELMKKLSS